MIPPLGSAAIYTFIVFSTSRGAVFTSPHTSHGDSVASAWLDIPSRKLDDVGRLVRGYLGNPGGLRSYCFDATQPPGGRVTKIWFSRFKRPTTLDFRGKPSGFIPSHVYHDSITVVRFSRDEVPDIRSPILPELIR